MDTSKYAALFIAESRDHLQQCSRQLLAWERDPRSPEPVQALFRSVHTLKGMAASLGYTRLANLAHAMEHVLAAAREGKLLASGELIDTAFRTVDRLERGVELAIAGQDEAFDAEALISELGQLTRPETGSWPTVPAGPGPALATPDEGRAALRIRLRAGTAMPGARAVLVLRQIEALGPVDAIQPPVASWAGESFTGEFSCLLQTTLDEAALRQVIGQAGDVEQVLVERGRVRGLGVAEAGRQVRVDLDRLDALVALTGELGVARTRIAVQVDRLGNPALQEEVHRLSRTIGELQDRVLQVRMAPVAEVFDRFPRAVRDLARQLGKQIRLEMAGSEIEMDRALLDRLPDLLLHLIRNAADHGLEPGPERVAAGKPAEGRIRLEASRERSTVRITVEDDGRGINRKAVRQHAAARGWAAGGAEGDGDDLLRLLARPGFSTAATVSAVSGRGVGIDAVVHGVRGLGGSAELRSQPGQGTAVTLRLPLTMAIVPALLVGVAGERYAVPLSYVAEAARVDDQAVRQGTVSFRGQAVPVVQLGRGGVEGGRRAGVILDVGGRHGALLVDTLLGQEDIVVSPLDAPRGIMSWVNGTTILSDGVPALILDPTVLV